MSDNADEIVPTIIPCLRYRDADAAVDWLCEAFDFERHRVVPGEDGKLVHAQLTFGDGMVMIGPVAGGEFGRHMAQPDECGDRGTQSPYVVVEDIEAHYARAREAGAEIVIELEDQEYGGALYSCRDPEGHLWNFGSYDPWLPEDDDEEDEEGEEDEGDEGDETDDEQEELR